MDYYYIYILNLLRFKLLFKRNDENTLPFLQNNTKAFFMMVAHTLSHL